MGVYGPYRRPHRGLTPACETGFVSAERSKRRDEKWAARYARSQVKAERIARQSGNDWPPSVTAVSTVTAPDGQHFRFLLIAPGEPTSDREYPFIILSYVAAGFFRGAKLPFDNDYWIVVAQRQRGPWRGFETIHRASFLKSADAAEHLRTVRQRVENGESIPATQIGTDSG